MQHSRIVPVALVLALLLVASGCQSTGGRETPVDDDPIEPRPLSTTVEPVAPVVSDTVGLDELIHIALVRNESVLQARQGVAVARAEVATAFGQIFLPRLVAAMDLTAQRPKPKITSEFGSFAIQPGTTTRTSISIQLPILHPAEALYGYPSTLLTTDLARFAESRTEQQIRSLVTSAFFRRIGLERLGEVIREFIRSLESQVQDTRVRVDAGAAIENDVLKIELELTRQKQALVENENAVEIAAMQLNTLLALPRNATYELIWEKPFALAANAPAQALVDLALDTRPDLQAQAMGIRQLELSRSREAATFYPTLDGFVTWAHSNPTTLNSADVTTLGFSLNWNLFDGTVRIHRAARIGYEIEQARSRLRDARRAVAIEVENALRELENFASAVALGGIAVDQAMENLRVQRALYRNQRSTANDLLEAEVQLTNAKDTVIQATYAYQIALGLLEAAVGVERTGLSGE